MDINKMLKDRIAGGPKLVTQVHPFLRCPTIPIPMKIAAWNEKHHKREAGDPQPSPEDG